MTRGRLLAGLLVLATLAAVGAWAFYFVGTDRPLRADAIVVLAGDVDRITTGVRLFHEHAAPRLLLSVYGETPQRLCDESGVTCFRAHPFSTQGEAETFARLARSHGWHSVIVVSSLYHLRRAAMLFRRCSDAGVEVTPAKTSAWNWLRNVPLETGKWLYQLTVDRDC